MTEIRQGDQFTDVSNGTLIEVTSTEVSDGKIQVATVGHNGALDNRRRLSISRLRTDSIDKNGRAYRSGWVLTSALPDGHPFKPVQPTRSVLPGPDDEFDPEALTIEELVAMGGKATSLAKHYGDMEKAIKAELKRRRKTAGVIVSDDTAAEFRPTKKFDAATAKANLSPEKYNQICKTAPDAKLAKAVLGEESDEYKSTLKDHGWTLTIRPATAEDRRKARKGEPEPGQQADTADIDAMFADLSLGDLVTT